MANSMVDSLSLTAPIKDSLFGFSVETDRDTCHHPPIIGRVGLSAALARRCAADGMTVALAARTGEKARNVAAETGAGLHLCDATSIDAVDRLFTDIDAEIGTLDLVVYNRRRVCPARST